MPDKKGNPPTDDNYQSTPEDKRRARILGVIHVVLAVFLAWMLFKIWPPTPWPTDKSLENNPQLAKNLKDCECPTPTPSPSSSAGTGTAGSAQNSNQSASASPTISPSPASSPAGSASPNAGGTASTNQPAATVSPSPSPTQTPPTSEALINIPINFFWGYWCYRTSFDERLILLVIVAGMLGSFVHGATSLADFIGNSKFNKNWTWFYLLRPSIGMALALVFYFVIRGGFLTTSGGAKDINPYGIAALAGLVGMFSKQATDKLSEVFGTLFRAAAGEGDDKRSGSLKPDGDAAKITITDVTPKFVTAGSQNQIITVTGTNFVNGSKMLLNDLPQDTTFVSGTKLTVKLADATIAMAKTVKLKVVNPDKKESVPFDYQVQ
jgi:hypothetical protein